MIGNQLIRCIKSSDSASEIYTSVITMEGSAVLSALKHMELLVMPASGFIPHRPLIPQQETVCQPGRIAG